MRGDARRFSLEKFEKTSTESLTKAGSLIAGQGCPTDEESSTFQDDRQMAIEHSATMKRMSEDFNGAVQAALAGRETTMQDIEKFVIPGSHWTENPMAMEMMKAMSFTYAVPALQPRLTKFHGTQIPVMILWFLMSTEIGRLAALDKFFKRIVTHPMIWTGIYCRDYDRYGSCKRCVWRALEGRAGSQRCLYHMNTTYPKEYYDLCKKITAIPGRLPEDLLESYCTWRAEQKALLDVLESHPHLKSNANTTAALEDTGTATNPDASTTALPGDAVTEAKHRKPWSVRAHSTYGLGITHRVRRRERTLKVSPVLAVTPVSQCRSLR